MEARITREHPLVGRARELASLDQALADMEQGPPVALELGGEPGIGKTRLLAELAARAESRGHLVLAGSASELERDLPLITVDRDQERAGRRALSARTGAVPASRAPIAIRARAGEDPHAAIRHFKGRSGLVVQQALGCRLLAGRRSVAAPETPQPAEREGLNWKVILLAALAIYALLLIILNRKTVSVDFVVVSEKTRVVWLVLLSIGLGMLIMWLVPRLRRRNKKRSRSSEPKDEASGIAGVSWKWILLGALAIYAVLLIVFNSKTVSLNFVFISTKTRVVWLVLLSVALGMLIMWLIPKIRRHRKGSRRPAMPEPDATATD
jgi:uncharacterized integral membrane protein